MKEIQVGLIGFGTVGGGLAQTLFEQDERLQRKTGCRIRLSHIADNKLASLPPPFSHIRLSQDATDLFANPDLDILVELIGGLEPARTFLLKAIAAGKHVVTANKALLSIHGREIFAAAAAQQVEVGFEASVGGGIPVIKTLKEGLVANKILHIRGILNGTANFILSKMTEEGAPFAEVLAEAQRLGYAEADPAYDIDGVDTAHKLAILASIAYGRHVCLGDVAVEGISRLEPIDIEFAHQFGCRIKLLAISVNHGEHIEVRVHPTMVPNGHMLATINGSFNAIEFRGDTVGDVLLYGRGAGQMPTGSAVAADVVDIARNIVHNAVGRVPPLAYPSPTMRPAAITPMSHLVCPWYFRVTALDQPGVLAQIAGIFGKYDISIKSVIQHGRDSKEPVHIVFHTHNALEESVGKALTEIDALAVCAAPTVKIRFLEQENRP
ncbi:MAG: homoserine dehydrogenase [Desulfobulbaceae bacterium]|jgi:homoserine dehydrogenase|nr:homoserine dehydrogenase [Desulfobulbaceae bacterium]